MFATIHSPTLTSDSNDDYVMVWGASTGELVAKWNYGGDGESVAWAGSVIAVGGRRGRLCLWHLNRQANGNYDAVEVLNTEIGESNDRILVCLSHDGMDLMLGLKDSDKWNKWGLPTAKVGYVGRMATSGSDPDVTSRWKSDGWVGHRVESMCFSPDSSRLLVGGGGRYVTVLDAVSLVPIQQLRDGAENTGGARVAWSSANVLASVSETRDDTTVALWHSVDGSYARLGSVRMRYDYDNTFNCVCFSPDGSRFLTGGSSLQLWDTSSRNVLWFRTLERERILAVEWSGGSHFLTINSENVVTVWSPAVLSSPERQGRRREPGQRPRPGDTRGRSDAWPLLRL